MRILHVISTLASSSGGPTSVVWGLSAAQAQAGHEVTVAATDRGNPVTEILDRHALQSRCPGGVELEVFAVSYAPLLYAPGMRAWLARSMRSFDIVHVHGLYRFPPTYAARLARRSGVPYLIRPHGALDPYLFGKSSRSRMLKQVWHRLLEVPNLSEADALHFTAHEERARVGYLGLHGPSFVMPNGIDWSGFRHLPEPGRLRGRWSPRGGPIVLFLGRLHHKKGLDLLVPAFARVVAAMPSARLVIAGPDSDGYGKKVRGWVRDAGLEGSVELAGELRGEDVLSAYVDSDLFVLPSYTENFGLAVAEAMACGLPVVVSDQVNIHADIARAGAGLVLPLDVEALAAGIVQLLGHDAERAAMGRAGRALVESRYTWAGIVGPLTREYEAVVERARRRRRLPG